MSQSRYKSPRYPCPAERERGELLKKELWENYELKSRQQNSQYIHVLQTAFPDIHSRSGLQFSKEISALSWKNRTPFCHRSLRLRSWILIRRMIWKIHPRPQSLQSIWSAGRLTWHLKRPGSPGDCRSETLYRSSFPFRWTRVTRALGMWLPVSEIVVEDSRFRQKANGRSDHVSMFSPHSPFTVCRF